MTYASSLSAAEAKRISDLLARPGLVLSEGKGDLRSPCSMAAINLALTGKLTDDTPLCMSEVIGMWVLHTQDEIPPALRNSGEWRALLPISAGTGRDPSAERARLDAVIEWMWPSMAVAQQAADKFGFGTEWREQRTLRSAKAAAASADHAALEHGDEKQDALISAGNATRKAIYAAFIDSPFRAAAAAQAVASVVYAVIGASDNGGSAQRVNQNLAAAWDWIDPIRMLRDLCKIESGDDDSSADG